MCKAYCGTATRVKILDEKVEYVKGIITTHRDNLNHHHSLRLERIIAGLICIEIFFHLVDHGFYKDELIAMFRKHVLRINASPSVTSMVAPASEQLPTSTPTPPAPQIVARPPTTSATPVVSASARPATAALSKPSTPPSQKPAT